MAKTQNSANTGAEESLADFKFNDDEDQTFFNIKPDTLGTEKVMKQVKAARTGDDIEDDDEGTSTNLDDEKDKNKKKDDKATSSKDKKKTKDGDDEEEPEEESDFSFDDEDNKSKRKPTEKKVESKKGKQNEDNEEPEDDDEEPDNNAEIDDTEVLVEFAKGLKEKGILANVKIPKDAKLTDDILFDFVGEELETRLSEALEDYAKNMDADGKAFMKFKRDGGNTHTFFTQYAASLNLKEFDEEKPEHVDKVLRHYIKTREQPEDEEQLEERIKFIKDSGKEKATAKRFYSIIKKDDDARQEAVIKIQEKAKEKAEESAKEFDEDLKEILNKADTIGVFTLSKAEQKELAPYINKPTVKVGKNRYVPQLTADLNKILEAETEKDMENLIILAKLIKSKFDMSGLVTKAQTVVASRAKSKLAEAKNSSSTRMATSGGYSRKSLADFID